jgi:hypothetical protein
MSNKKNYPPISKEQRIELLSVYLPKIESGLCDLIAKRDKLQDTPESQWAQRNVRAATAHIKVTRNELHALLAEVAV